MSSETPFGRFYDEHVWAVYGFIAFRVRGREQAEDLTQQCFEQALAAWDRFDPEKAGEKTWILTIARNLVIDHYRSSRGGEVEIDQATAEGARMPSSPSLEESAQLGPDPALADALQMLSERDREIIALRFVADLPAKQIAATMEMSLAAVQQAIKRALDKLAVELEGSGFERPGP